MTTPAIETASNRAGDFSFWPDTFNKFAPLTVQLPEIVARIRAGEWAAPVAEIRAMRAKANMLSDPAARKAAEREIKHRKTLLPSITASGTFETCKNEGIIAHSGLLVADLDKLGADLELVRERIEESPYWAAVHLSPSGDGLKVYFRVPPDASLHAKSFEAVSAHVVAITGRSIDGACKNLARRCFMSDDGAALYRQHAETIPLLSEEDLPIRSQPTANRTPHRISPVPTNDAERVADALRAIPSDDRESWFRYGGAIHDAFGPAGRSIWDEWSRRSDRFNEADQEKTWRGYASRSGTKAGLGSIFKEAKDRGWKPEERRRPDHKLARLAGMDGDGESAARLGSNAYADDSADVDGVVLPSGRVSLSACARVLFPRLAKTKAIFTRGGAIVELVRTDGIASLEIVKPDGFRSRAETVGPLVAWRKDGEGAPVLKRTTMSRDIAAALMATPEARTLLPGISCVMRCPIMVERDGKAAVLGKGYHPDAGGVLIEGDVNLGDWETITVKEAAGRLSWLVREFHFQSEGDLSRALAAFLTPALRMGGLLTDPIVMDVAEANMSQAGKGHRHEMVAAVYNEIAYVVTARKGGVGSTDESFSSALVAARPFICWDNVRGKVDSQTLESFLTAPGLFSARVPGRAEVLVDPRRFLLQMSSNGMESTPDLANRSSICRILKRPGFAYADTLGAVKRDPGHYLAAVFRLIAEWIAAGKPRTTESRHDRRQWCQTLDWFCRELLGCVPLMDGHQDAQERTSNPALSWLRSVALALDADQRLGEGLIATQLVELCAEHGIECHGARGEIEQAARMIGISMRRLFAAGDSREIDGYRVTRRNRKYQKPSGDYSYTPEYAFAKL